jgi:hypothetical protein
MDTQQQRETQQVHVIQTVSGDELKNQSLVAASASIKLEEGKRR